MTAVGVDRRTVLSLTALGGAAVLTGCGGYDDPTGGTSGGTTPDTLTVAQPNDVATMDGVLDNGLYSVNVFHGLYDQLVQLSPEGDLEPRLATGWASNEDGSSWTFTVRTDALFHDGSPVTSADIAYSFQAVMDSETSGNKIYTNAIAAVTAPAEDTVQFDLKAPNSVFPRLAYYIVIVPQAAYADPAAFASNPIGSGPYKFVSWTPDVSVDLAVFEDYWGEAPGVPNVSIQPVPDEEARVNGLLSGTLDLCALAPTQVETVKNTDGFSVEEYDGNQIVYLGVNTSAGPLADAAVRRAIDSAINREGIITSVLQGMATAAGQSVAPPVNGWSENLQPVELDLDAAKASLAASTYAGEPITLQFPSNGNVPSSTAVAQAIAAQLEDAGITIQLEGIDTATFNLAWSSKQLTGLYLTQFSPSMMDAATTLNYLYGPTGNGYFRDPQIDDLITQAAATVDAEARLGIIEQVWQRNASEAFIVNLYSTKNAYGLVDGLTWKPRGDGHLDFVSATYA